MMKRHDSILFILMLLVIVLYGNDEQKKVAVQSVKESPVIARVRNTEKRRLSQPDLLKVVSSGGRDSGANISNIKRHNKRISKNSFIENNSSSKTSSEQNNAQKS